MPRPKKASTPKGIKTYPKHQVNVTMSPETYAALKTMAADQRRQMSNMARLILEDATGTAPE